MSKNPKDLSGPAAVEVTLENFEAEVVERSYETPVVVDFWAEWCGPCKTLGPVLDKVAREFDGQVVLAKADTETVPEIAQAFNIRSIPAVFALKNGKVVDSFVGALSESAVREFVRKLLPSKAETAFAEARAAEEADPAAAEPLYRAVLDINPADPAAKAGLGRVLLHLGRPGEASAIVKELEGRGFLEPEAEALKAEVELHAHSQDTGGVDAARATLAANPGDPELSLKLAETLAAAGHYEEALAIGLDLVETRRRTFGEPARQLMVNVFQLLPPDSSLAHDFRRKLSMALFD